ncbi:toll/interleukin-1 receptor domain-containing protein [Kitasatospora purpeofusca]|uniref:toll/interleukin-1 receptor domain-containing protein n=1 Tax=Kitasatospora purpeofusca TaxID=67352 RepID=UPI002259BAF4|nr:toll/interleukin-1 receptor domain-containing protein [Kitasatospora purpeofusca]MCX4685236.1 toll/interleukin-1 receptor domain-containing protein [Kitasatospora purpeofusca]
MAENGPVGFWSYTHRDDELVDGRILRLAKAIGDAFELITGEELGVFVDNKDISWGDAWRARIDSALLSGTFLIPVVTPKFFLSQECRREVLTFAGNAASLGVSDLLLPILYVDVPALADNPASDEVVALIASRQWVDWRDLRLEDEGSPAYRKAVVGLAERLNSILSATQIEPIRPAVVGAFAADGGESESLDDAPGFLEVMAKAEAAMPKWAQTMISISEVTSEVGAITVWAAGKMKESDEKGEGFAGRVAIANQLKDRLEAPVERYAELGSQYSAELVAIDPAILAMIRQIAEEELGGEVPDASRESLSGIKALVEASKVSLPSLQELAESSKAPAQLVSSLRPVMKKLQAAIQQVVDSRTILDEWGRRIDELGL